MPTNCGTPVFGPAEPALLGDLTVPRGRLAFSSHLRWLTGAFICLGFLVWLGLAVFGFAMIFQGEGSYSPGRQLLIALMDVFLIVGCWAMAASLRVLWTPPARRRLPPAILVIVSAQLAVLLWALSLAHFVRSGEAWVNSSWRRLLSDMGLVELFAYYPWIGGTAMAAALMVVALMLVRLRGRGRDAGSVMEGESPAR